MEQNPLSSLPDIILQSTAPSTRSEVELSEAIQACGARCMDSPDPKGCVEAYGVELIASGWSAKDVKTVERGTLRVLATIKQDNSLLPQDG